MSEFDPFKVCMACKHLEYDQGDYAYSDVTPGCPPSFSCKKHHWYTDLIPNNNKQELHEYMDKARTCKDFEVRTS